MGVESNTTEVLRGTLEECFKRWARDIGTRHPKGSKGLVDARTPMANFCGVSPSTVSDWALGRQLPRGLPWFKLAFFLDILGYRVVELSALPEINRNFAELLAYDSITPREAANLMGYKGIPLVYRMLRDENKPLPHKITNMWDFWKGHRIALEEKRRETVRRLAGKPAGSATIELTANDPKILNDSNDVAGVIEIMSGLIILLESRHVLAGDFSESRSKAVVLRLSAYLSGLCSRLMEE